MGHQGLRGGPAIGLRTGASGPDGQAPRARGLPGRHPEHRGTGAAATAYTDANGRHAFAEVPVGPGRLTFRLLNFSLTGRTIMVVEHDTTTADAVLRLALSADVVVTGHATFRNVADVERPSESLFGIAGSASQGAVTTAQTRTRPVQRSGDILETVPGLVVSQHSGEGKANQ